ncbi:ABC transporter ATP-binding protein [Actinokineospora auranticolor]|uniref:ATP-binding cassette subfamily B protein n=1 Tax=Actinokineospora auranticolor TaxID=155976 RepID=A0A2S6GEI9_9PSEU|nr:ABC transporter ATP-binding protein [Actinokineospora auranticolor]PPK63645.1 ATP-binding cassette subfamily B protein [Actinokineospora auranticolor]
MELLRGALRRERVVLGAGLAATVVQQIAFLAMPWCVQHGLDEGITPGDSGRTLFWSSTTAVVAVVMMVSAAAGKWWSGLAAHRVAHRLRADLAARAGTLDRAAIAPFGQGDLAMRVTRDTEMINAWVQGLTRWARVVVTVALVLPAVGAMDPPLLLVLVLAMPVLGLVNAQFPGRYRRANERLSTAHGKRADAVEDLLSASAAVRGLGGEQVLVRRHDEVSAHVTRHTMGVARVSAWWVSAPPAVLRVAVAIGLAVGGLAAIDGRITVGSLVAFTSWMITMTVAVTVLVDLLVNRGQARVAAGRVAEVLAAKPAVAAPADPRPLPESGMLAAVGVRAVRDGRAVVGPVDLMAAPGELVVVTGPTGSGKSVLVRLLCRLDDPDSGTVHFGGVDLRLADPEQVWRRIGVVPQRPVVLSGTIRDNVTLDRDVDLDLVREACRVAALDEFIDGLPGGYDTVVGERGETLSGGQVQRLALARGLLAKPPVLVLDDVTSAVDADTEQTILRRLREWSPETAVVFVSHRSAVVAAADRLIRLDEQARMEVVGG